jgi:hypothetical protein
MPSSTDVQLPPLLRQRKLGLDDAAGRADLSPEELREALELAGRPARRDVPQALPRILAAAALAAIFAVLAVALADARVASGGDRNAGAATLPAPWRISVDVLNGSGDINHTRRLADRVAALAYHVTRVRRADRFDYRETAVYYEPGGNAIAARLASDLGVETKPLPGGSDPRHLIVIVGPATLQD